METGSNSLTMGIHVTRICVEGDYRKGAWHLLRGLAAGVGTQFRKTSPYTFVHSTLEQLPSTISKVINVTNAKPGAAALACTPAESTVTGTVGDGMLGGSNLASVCQPPAVQSQRNKPAHSTLCLMLFFLKGMAVPRPRARQKQPDQGHSVLGEPKFNRRTAALSTSGQGSRRFPLEPKA